ncbi:MAG: DUF2231 domain-containing protein, partial [Bacteroidota bacterium]
MSFISGEFIGRFHPLLVHLPIGFLFAAIALECLVDRKKHLQLFSWLWLIGFLSAAGAAVAGWLLAEAGSYAEDTLTLHRWAGIGLVVLASIGWLIKRQPDRWNKFVQWGINFSVLGGLFMGGHQGGNLTHGPTYLVEKASPVIQRLAGYNEQVQVEREQLRDPSSTLVYNDLIRPIFIAKCVVCHNNEVTRGGLNMSTPELLIAGGDSGPSIDFSEPLSSEILRRLSLDNDNPKYMPPKGTPLTYLEKRLIEWWLIQDELFEKSVAESEPPEAIKAILLELYGLDTDPKPYYETVEVLLASEQDIVAAQAKGFSVQPLSENNNFLDVRGMPGRGPMTEERLSSLMPLANYITWLDLSDMGLTDDLLAQLPTFPHLTRMRLEKNLLTDASIPVIARMPQLNSLNLYENRITDAAVGNLAEIDRLESLF